MSKDKGLGKLLLGIGIGAGLGVLFSSDGCDLIWQCAGIFIDLERDIRQRIRRAEYHNRFGRAFPGFIGMPG